MLLHELLDDAVSAVPQGTALSSPLESCSYARLDRAANAIAACLGELGVQPGDRVGILLPKQPEAIAAIYAISKTGAAFVPLDHLAPAPYVATICADCSLSALITTSTRASMLIESLPGRLLLGVVLVDEPGALERDLPVPSVRCSDADSAPGFPKARGDAGDTACLLYTSGSSGAPKGVMHSHEALLAGTRWFSETMGIGPDDRLYAHAPLHFMLSIYAIFPAAQKLATTVLSRIEQPMRGDLARLVPTSQVTVWISTPHPLRLLLSSARDDSLSTLRVIMAGGGTLVGRDIEAIRRLAPRVSVWQAYGSTEAQTVCCHRVTDAPGADERLAIGEPLSNVTVLLVGEDANEGELYVRSARLMRGYWGDPERTARVLVPHPFNGEAGGLFYRTGDIVKRQEDGKLEFVKRTDLTVKSRGYRVDLSEVEGSLNEHPAVRESVVVAIPHPQWGVAIAASVELEQGTSSSASELRAHLVARLPSYMVPQHFRILAELPRKSTGKVDRQLLVTEFSDTS